MPPPLPPQPVAVETLMAGAGARRQDKEDAGALLSDGRNLSRASGTSAAAAATSAVAAGNAAAAADAATAATSAVTAGNAAAAADAATAPDAAAPRWPVPSNWTNVQKLAFLRDQLVATNLTLQEITDDMNRLMATMMEETMPQ